LWLVPLAFAFFEALNWYRGWPRGEGKALASVAALVALTFVVSLRARTTAAGRPAAAAGT